MSFGIVLLLFLWVPASTLTFLAMIPALVFGIYSHRLFIAFLGLIIFLGAAFLFYELVMGNISEVSELASLFVFLYKALYPYGLQLNVIAVLGGPVILLVLGFLLFVIILAQVARFSEIQIMISFSYFSLVFTSFYLLCNMFLYLLPFLRDLIFESPVLQFMLSIFYGIIPLIILTLAIYCLLSLFKRRTRAQLKQSIQPGKEKGLFSKVMKYMTYIVLVVFILVMVLTIIFTAY